jgi:hypothetical protein
MTGRCDWCLTEAPNLRVVKSEADRKVTPKGKSAKEAVLVEGRKILVCGTCAPKVARQLTASIEAKAVKA